MKQQDIQFLQQLQAKLNAADNDPMMHDYQANPRFWVVMDKKYVESEHGEPHILDNDYYSIYTIEEYIECIRVEICHRDKDELYEQFVKLDKTDIYNVCEFAAKVLKHDTRVVKIELQDCIASNTFFLTKDEAQKHIKANHHHYCDPRTYAMTAWRSPEFERFFNLFKQFDFSAVSKTIDKACEVLHKTCAFELMAAQEGMSAACMEDQFRKTMEEQL